MLRINRGEAKDANYAMSCCIHTQKKWFVLSGATGMKELAVAIKMCAGTLKVAIVLEEKRNTRLFGLKEGEDCSMELWTKLA